MGDFEIGIENEGVRKRQNEGEQEVEKEEERKSGDEEEKNGGGGGRFGV